MFKHDGIDSSRKSCRGLNVEQSACASIYYSFLLEKVPSWKNILVLRCQNNYVTKKIFIVLLILLCLDGFNITII